MNISCASQASNFTNTLGGHQIWEVALIILITGPLSLATIVGNLLVVISIRVNRNLHTVNNYFLLSLAVADLILGTISMNLYTTYIIMGRWPLGNLACDIWLAIDYVTSNASVMNLLVISFDRFFSVTRPLTYRVKRTPRRAGIMIGLAWAVSFVLWAPAILFWEYIEGRRKVQDGECFIQFFSQPIITFATAIAAFYLPVTIMIFLYWRVYRETKNRTRDLSGLLASVVAHGPSQPPRCCWELEEEASNSTSSEEEHEQDAKGVSALVVRVPLIQMSDVQEHIKENITDSGIRRMHRLGARQLGSLPSFSTGKQPGPNSPKPPITNKRRSMIVKEKKAARTLTAILLAFIITWTPYNIMVLLSIFYCVPEKLWQLGYWLCYVNSTVNPVCYALCNESFRITFKRLLLCRWDRRKWAKPQQSLCRHL
uniref:Muscarinic acetylcholine receptor n=1 Tax=Scleropages formosus TaxID=113540 RepID=A0A8C9U3L4_SCLFO